MSLELATGDDCLRMFMRSSSFSSRSSLNRSSGIADFRCNESQQTFLRRPAFPLIPTYRQTTAYLAFLSGLTTFLCLLKISQTLMEIVNGD